MTNIEIESNDPAESTEIVESESTEMTTETSEPTSESVEDGASREILNPDQLANESDDSDSDVTAPRFVMPKSADDIEDMLEMPVGDPKDRSVKQAIRTVNTVTSVLMDLMEHLSNITEIDTKLAQQTDMFADESLLVWAQTTDKPEIKKSFLAYEKLVARVAAEKDAVIKAVLAEIGDEKLSDEEVAAKKADRKTTVETIHNSTSLLEGSFLGKLEGDNLDFTKFFLENLKIPSASGKGSTAASSGSATGMSFKPRMNGGSVYVVTENGSKSQGFPNFQTAAKFVGSLTKQTLTSNDLGQQWLDANNESVWQNITGKSEWDYNADIHIVAIRNAEKPA